MGRRRQVETIKKVRYECCKVRHNFSIQKISRLSGVRWETTKNALEILEACGVVKKMANNRYNYLGFYEDIAPSYHRLVWLHRKVIDLKRYVEELEKHPGVGR